MNDGYINDSGSMSPAKHNLTPEREKELREHLRTCEVALATCKSCQELYQSVGHAVYVELLTEGMDVEPLTEGME